MLGGWSFSSCAQRRTCPPNGKNPVTLPVSTLPAQSPASPVFATLTRKHGGTPPSPAFRFGKRRSFRAGLRRRPRVLIMYSVCTYHSNVGAPTFSPASLTSERKRQPRDPGSKAEPGAPAKRESKHGSSRQKALGRKRRERPATTGGGEEMLASRLRRNK